VRIIDEVHSETNFPFFEALKSDSRFLPMIFTKNNKSSHEKVTMPIKEKSGQYLTLEKEHGSRSGSLSETLTTYRPRKTL